MPLLHHSLFNSFQEVQHLHQLLALPEPASGRGYWVSKAWLSNHRR